MRKANHSAQLTEDQAAVAQTGVKALIPIERPFLDYVLTRLADAGYKRVCLIVGPEQCELRDYYSTLECHRLIIEFAEQLKPLGTADAVLAAEDFAAGEQFVVINSDNYYPTKALSRLRQLDGCGLVGFDRDGMIAGSNIEPERIKNFAVIEVNGDGSLTRIVEKPKPEFIAQMPKPVCLSMNCWRLNPAIFTACRAIKPSARGELELPDAVQFAIDTLGQKFRVIGSNEAVLDLSSRKDIKGVTEKLVDEEVSL